MKIKNPLWIGVALLALSGCGGGGGSESSMPVLPSGQVDASYGISGKATVTPVSSPARMAVDSGGNAYVTGAEIVKLDADGRRIASFGDGGRVILESWSPVVDEAGDLYVLTAEGIAKVDRNGRIDPTFGSNGRAASPVPPLMSVSSRLARDVAGNLYVAGALLNVGGDAYRTDWWVAKFDGAGRPAATFGAAGYRQIAFPYLFYVSFDVRISVDPQGRVLLGGEGLLGTPGQGGGPAQGAAGTFLLIRLEPQGGVDAGFGDGGRWMEPRCGHNVTQMTALALDGTGNALVAGNCGGDGYAVIIKVDPAGRSIASFRESGMRTGIFGVVGEWPRGASIESAWVAPDGTIYVAGVRGTAPFATGGICDDTFAVAKLDERGEPVVAFGDRGIAIFDISRDAFRDVAAAPGSGLYVGGISNESCDGVRPRTYSYVVYRVGR